MRIGIVQPRISYYEGGGEKFLIEYAKNLVKARHEVVIYTLKPFNKHTSSFYKDLLTVKSPELFIREFPVPGEYRDIFAINPGEDRNRWDKESLLFNQMIFSRLNSDNLSVILSCYILDGVFRPLHIPAVIYLSGYPTDYVEIRKSLLRFFNATVSISNNVKEKWSSYFTGNKNFVINTGVSDDDVKKTAKSKFPINIVFAGRLIERKGLETLIKTMVLLRKKYPELHLWVLGDGPYKENLESQIKVNHLLENVTLKGHTNRVFEYFRMADICVFPSYEKEGLMGVVLEAMLAGKPVITTKNNGSEDVIRNGVNGILVEPRSERQLAEAIDKILTDPILHKQIGAKAKEYATKNLTWKKATTKLIKVFNKIIK